MESIATVRAINMKKNLQKRKKSIHEAICTLLPNLNFNRQIPTIVTCWKETLIEKNPRRYYQIITIQFKMHIPLFIHSAFFKKNQYIIEHSEVRAEIRYQMQSKIINLWIMNFFFSVM